VASIEYTITPLPRDAKSAIRLRSFDFRKLKIKKGINARAFGTELTKVVYKHRTLIERPLRQGAQTKCSRTT
jgi:hypothetical protein